MAQNTKSEEVRDWLKITIFYKVAAFFYCHPKRKLVEIEAIVKNWLPGNNRYSYNVHIKVMWKWILPASNWMMNLTNHINDHDIHTRLSVSSNFKNFYLFFQQLSQVSLTRVCYVLAICPNETQRGKFCTKIVEDYVKQQEIFIKIRPSSCPGVKISVLCNLSSARSLFGWC